MTASPMSSDRVMPTCRPGWGRWLLSAVLMANCGKGGDPSTPPPPGKPTAAVTPNPLPLAPAAPPGQDGSVADPMSTLVGRLDLEKHNRPPIHPNVDDGFEALARDGLVIAAPEQSLASTYKASYCRQGTTAPDDLSILICEYPDDAHAAAGFAQSKKIFPTLEARHAYLHKNLLLVTTFRTAKVAQETRAAEAKAVATLRAL